jgi:hypothetical protein
LRGELHLHAADGSGSGRFASSEEAGSGEDKGLRDDTGR